MSSPKEEIQTLLSRESRFDTIQKRRKSALLKRSEEECSNDQRDLASQWMLEVVNDSSGVKEEVFLLSVTIMDSFLEVCPILGNQVQLLASACLLLAAKIRRREEQLNEAKIIDYTDNSISPTELKAWEMLVLSKMDWDVNLVIALDYLEPLNSLLTQPRAETNELKNLICTLSSRYATFRAIYPPRTVALAALRVEKPQILQLFQATTSEQEKVLNACKAAFDQIRTRTPPNNLSPFKADSTSTPKTCRTPLRESGNTEMTLNIRRRLTSLSEEAKENNDSAIGLCTESPAPSSSSSKHSSPGDSGASSGTSPKSHNDVKELDKLLASTHLESP